MTAAEYLVLAKRDTKPVWICQSLEKHSPANRITYFGVCVCREGLCTRTVEMYNSKTLVRDVCMYGLWTLEEAYRATYTFLLYSHGVNAAFAGLKWRQQIRRISGQGATSSFHEAVHLKRDSKQFLIFARPL